MPYAVHTSPACTGRWRVQCLVKSEVQLNHQCCRSFFLWKCYSHSECFYVFMIPCRCILPPLELIQQYCTCCRISLVVACVNRERPPSGGWRGLSCGNNILMRIRLFLLHDTVWINFYFEYIPTVSPTTLQLYNINQMNLFSSSISYTYLKT